MPQKEVNPEEAYENIKPSLLQYVELSQMGGNEPQAIFDDILTIEERYEESSLIDQGGMKKILKTQDSLTNRPVAKAILLDFEDPSKTENFLREARITASLEHPNIMPIYDIGVDEKEGPYFIMKLIGGRNLASILKSLSSNEEGTEYTLRELMIIFFKVCDAVAYAHSKGIIHLDLKPENIQVGDFGEVLLCDWGLAKVLDQPEDLSEARVDLDPCIYNDVTLDGCIKGTPGYMAPEQVNPDVGPKNQKTDIYALGGILYSLLCYKAPFESDTLEGVLKDTLVGDLPLPSERAGKDRNVPQSLEAVAMKALEIDPKWRYDSVSELRQEINKWMGGFATDAENAGFLTSLTLLLKRHKAVSALLAVILISAGFSFYKIKQNEQKAKDNEKVAIANEQKALANEKKALENEQKAKDALALYKKEKQLTGEISDHAIDQLKVINDYYLENLNFDKAIQFIDGTIEFQPENELLNALKGETHFYRQEYDQALTCLNKAGEFKDRYPYKLMIKHAPEFAIIMEDRDFLEAKDLAELVFSFNEDTRIRLFGFEAQKYSSGSKYRSFLNDPLKLPFLKNHMELCRLLIIKGQKKPEKVKLNYRFTLDKDGINLDLSNSKGFDRAKYITHLPMKSLNIENTFFWRQWIFDHYFLKSVNITNTNIQKMSYNTLNNAKFKEVILSKEQYAGSDIRGGVLKKINFIVK